MHDAVVEILLVEDDPRDAEMALSSLRKRRPADRVAHVRDGAEALERLLGKEAPPLPRLVLSDLKMPRVDGHELLEALRADARTRALPVVLLSSSDQEPDIERAYALGANSYVVKPADFDEFEETVAGIGAYWLLLNHSPA